MKVNILILFVMFFVSCGREDKSKLEAYNVEAFAFQLDGGWEVNASVRVKGFQQNAANGKYTSRIFYTVGIITPANDTIRNLYTDRLNEKQSEELTDIPVEVQIELDSAYSAGKYKLFFDIKDELSGKNTAAFKELQLD